MNYIIQNKIIFQFKDMKIKITKQLIPKIRRVKLIVGILLFVMITIGIVNIRLDQQQFESYQIIIREDSFYPRFLDIKEGDEVVFKNITNTDHWPASNIHPTHDLYPEFDPKHPIKPSQSWSLKFKKVGQWRFHDHLYSTISGEIKVIPNTNSLFGKIKEISSAYSDKMMLTKLWFIEKKFAVYFHFSPEQKNKYFEQQNIKSMYDKSDTYQLALLIKMFGPEKIIKQLFSQSNQGKSYNCHIPAHEVGRVAYKVLGDKALSYNLSYCASGYNHGMMAGFVSGLSENEIVSQIRQKCNSLSPMFLRTNCFHGAGHGLMAYFDYDLPKTITSCQEIGEYYSTGNCLVGAFMENIGTQFGDSLIHQDTNWLDKNDPHFPCNKIDQTYQVQRTCYAIQTGWMMYIYNKDLKKTVNACLNASNDVIADCFFGYGQTTGLMAGYNPGRSVLYCQNIPDQGVYRDYCYAGGIMNLILFWGANLGNRGTEFCKAVPIKTSELVMNI
jgi:hypothetical protein